MNAKNIAKLFDNPNFSKWFGSSQVVGDDGLPAIAYHGTKGDIESFNLKGKNRTGGKAYFFSSDPEFASMYANKGGNEGGKVYPVALKSENMFKHDDAASVDKLQSAIDDILAREKSKPYGKGRDFYPYTKTDALNGIGTGRWDWLEHPIVIDAMKKSGFDGARLKEGDVENYMVFKPTQIKSVFNEGTFDPTNPNILKAALPFAAGTGLMAAMSPSDAAAIQRIRENDAPLQEAWNPLEAFAGGLGGGVKAAAAGVLPDGAMDWAINRLGGLMSGGK